MERIGIFEVDCRERADAGQGLSYVGRAAPFRDRIEKIYAFAENHGIPLVFTTCCSNRLLSKEDSRGALVVPMDPDDASWIKDVASRPLIYIEKTTWGSPEQNRKHCSWDMFVHNGNARMLFDALAINHWIVYGVGIDLCVHSAVRGLLSAGCKATILTDILTNNAGGTAETMQEVLQHFREQGVATISSQEFLRMYQQAVA